MKENSEMKVREWRKKTIVFRGELKEGWMCG
jgi:hypothetical protein